MSSNLPVEPALHSPLDSLKQEHPRLLVTPATWAGLQEERQQDPLLDGFLRKMEADAVAVLALPPMERILQGRRLLHVSRQVLRRVLLLGLQYRVSGEERFAARAEHEMLAAAEFQDWNPSHFLDTAEMSCALGIGYDWFFEVLGPESREVIRTAIVDKGVRLCTEPQYSHWLQNKNNWNEVCLAGMAVGSLAVAEDEPELAAQVLALVREHNHNGLWPYQPDGIYPEGPMYWSYGTTFEAILLDALNSALGTDWGLSQSPGFLQSVEVFLQMTGPSGKFFNFSDCIEPAGLEPAVFWFAKRLERPEFLMFQRRELEEFNRTPDLTPNSEVARLFPLTALWWPRQRETKAKFPPLSWSGDGPNPLAFFRTSWTDPNAMYLAVKAGRASVSHGHMDAGTFIFECDGVRWAKDLGLQSYHSLESKGAGVWDSGQDGERWKIYRWNNFVHNTLTINGQLHRIDGKAEITAFDADSETQSVVLDLTPVFGEQAVKVVRRFAFRPNRDVVIEDELEGLQPGDEVRWVMVTEAQVHIDGRDAVLELDDRQLRLRVLSPADARLEVIPADPPDNGYDEPNPNTRIVRVKAVAPESGRVEIVVRLERGE